MRKPCPCTSGLTYASCCAPLHRGDREAEAPEALMRARFAAFALGDIEFLWRTLHPDHDDRRASEEPVRAALKLASRSLKFMRLRILDAEGPRVLFLAAVFEKGTDRSFLELSTFARDGDAWRYLSGVSRDARAAEEPVATTIDAFLRAGGDA